MSHLMLLSRRPIPQDTLEWADQVGELSPTHIEWTNSFSDLLSVLR